MELLAYWRIVRKRLWLVVVLVLVVAATLLMSGPAAPSGYVANMRFVVGLKPEVPRDDGYTYDRYYTWLTAEYLLDDLAEVVKSQMFAADVAATSGIAIAPGAIQGATQAGKLHRILTITVGWYDAEQLANISNAIVQVLEQRGGRYFAQFSTDNAVLSLIDPPTISPVGRSLRQRLDVPLRLILALVAGLGLTFLLDYLDQTVRGRSDARSLGVPILAEIPPEPRRGIVELLWRRRLP